MWGKSVWSSAPREGKTPGFTEDPYDKRYQQAQTTKVNVQAARDVHHEGPGGLRKASVGRKQPEEVVTKVMEDAKTCVRPGDDPIFSEFCRLFETPFLQNPTFKSSQDLTKTCRIRDMMFEMYANSQPWMWSALMLKPKCDQKAPEKDSI